jgi:integrase
MPLTDAQIKSLKPGPTILRVPDGGGMYLEVAPNGAKRFRQTYRYAGSKRTVTLGEWPHLRLAEARRHRAEIKGLLYSGTDPRTAFGPTKATAPDLESEQGLPTWEPLVRRYLAKRKLEGAAPATVEKLALHADVTIRVMGDRAVERIGPRDVIECCRHYEEQEFLASASKVRVLCSQVFRFAIAHGEAQSDPAAAIKDAIAKPKPVGRPGITAPREVGELMRALRSYPGEPAVRAGLLLSAYLFPRNSELREMRWDQFDGDTWVVPPEQMKMNREHLVPLPRQAVEVLEWIKPFTHSTGLVLYSPTSASGRLSENTFNQALRRVGIPKERHVHHGFRTAFSTNMHELGWNSDWIELQLAHVEENKVKGAYNRALYMEGRTQMMQAYADWLDEQAEKA